MTYPWAPEGILTAEHTAAYQAIARGCTTARQLAEVRQISPRLAQALIDDLAQAQVIHSSK
jgi:DNA-binding IscR family transcriptional regulator